MSDEAETRLWTVRSRDSLPQAARCGKMGKYHDVCQNRDLNFNPNFETIFPYTHTHTHAA